MRFVERPIYCRPSERHWYRIADWVQPRWRRFADSRWGWYFGLLLAVFVRVLRVVGAAVLIVGFAVLYMVLEFAVTGGQGRRR